MYLTSLKDIPSINKIIQEVKGKEDLHEDYLKFIIKDLINIVRAKIKKKDISLTKSELKAYLIKSVLKKTKHNLVNIINGTGIVLHTGFGRAPFNASSLRNIADRVEGYTNLEFDLNTGKRGDRQKHITDLLSSICGSESAMAVNNNAGAVMLAINELAQNGGEVICSRGQLVEIGGSFRIPDIIRKSDAKLIEVGTTNRTHIYDYENAINSKTKLLLQVHTSNYIIKGYTKSVKLSEMVKLGKKYDIPVMTDWGSGTLLDINDYFESDEIPIKKIMKKGPCLITFSGDKLIGGPQSGLIVGDREYIKMLKRNTLYRTLRCNKVTIALLEEILRSYRTNSFKKYNLSLNLLTSSRKDLKSKGLLILDLLKKQQVKKFNIKLKESDVEAGSGSLPGKKIESMAFTFKSQKYKAEQLAFSFRNADYPVVGYILNDIFHIDLKAIIPNQFQKLVKTINKL
jgi:L-seryl-tRNA(Ser) seleniumtransferase